MPSTFLLLYAIIGTAALAPIVAAASVFALTIPRLRPLAAGMLRAGAIGAAAGLALDVVLNLALDSTPTRNGLFIAAGIGFVIVGIGWSLWLLRSNRAIPKT